MFRNRFIALATLAGTAGLVIASHNLAIGFLNLIRGIPTDQGAWF